jgi:hypothetical protein
VFYSVAEHCWHVAKRLVSLGQPFSVIQAGLLHDADEAYLTDLPNPIKREPEFAWYRNMGNRLRARIFQRFGIGPIRLTPLNLGQGTHAYESSIEPGITELDMSLIDAIDKEMVKHEAATLFDNIHPDWQRELDSIPTTFTPAIQEWRPAMAKRQFLQVVEWVGLIAQ